MTERKPRDLDDEFHPRLHEFLDSAQLLFEPIHSPVGKLSALVRCFRRCCVADCTSRISTITFSTSMPAIARLAWLPGRPASL
jgi:hypothetical protein